jgi:hypothetical protein
MKRFIFSALLLSSLSFQALAQSTPRVQYEYKQISTIESVVPGGMGRSRIVSTELNGQVIEKELKNFYSLVGINFGNISNNDEVIVTKLNEMSADGWDLFTVTTGSNQQSSGGSSSGGLLSRAMYSGESKVEA